VYTVPNGCTVTLDFKSGKDINCVSLDLGVGSSVDVKYPTGKPENYIDLLWIPRTHRHSGSEGDREPYWDALVVPMRGRGWQ